MQSLVLTQVIQAKLFNIVVVGERSKSNRISHAVYTLCISSTSVFIHSITFVAFKCVFTLYIHSSVDWIYRFATIVVQSLLFDAFALHT